MRRIAIMALAALLVLLAATPALAGSKLRHRAHVLHSKVERQVSDRAAGRDISTEGIRIRRNVARPATARELREFIDTLDRMLHPPAPPAPVAVATPPATASPAPTSSSSGASTASPAPSTPSSGGYCGAYQFDARTWQSVGGSGTACGASPAEQDKRAQLLLQQRGTSPWPNCGSTDLAAIRQCENSGSYR
jgi:hypothetical protein